MNIKKNDLVLEIGSGNRPYPRSNILCDRYIHNTGHRQPGSKIIIDRPFVIANAERLPFKDKSVDYIIASHIIEHLNHPDTFIKEIQRVGKAGYLAFPKPLLERFYKNAPHKWYCDWNGKVLVLRKKTNRNRRKPPIKAEDERFARIMRFLPSETHCSFEWHNTIPYKLFSSESRIFLEEQDRKITYFMKSGALLNTFLAYFLQLKDMLFSLKLETTRFLERMYYKMTIKTDLFSVLCCPYCRGDVTAIHHKIIRCRTCSRQYRLIRNTIPKML